MMKNLEMKTVAMKKAGILMFAGALAAGGLMACSEETAVPEGEAQTAIEQPAMPETSGDMATNTVAATESVTEPAVTEEIKTEMMEESSPAERAFVALDTNNDAMISKEEAMMNVTIGSEFAEIDLDQDQLISLNEFIVYAGEATAAGADEEPVSENQ